MNVKYKSENRSILAFATQGKDSNDELRLKNLLSNLNVEYYPFKRDKKFNSFLEIVRTIKKKRNSLIIMEGTGFFGGLALIIGKKLFNADYVFSSGDAVYPYLTRKVKYLKPLFYLYEKMLYSNAIGFIGWTPYLAGRALTYGTKFVMTAPGWSPYEKNNNRSEINSIRESIGIQEDDLVIGIVGSLHWDKKLSYCYGSELVSAAKLIKRDNVKFLIIGDGTGKKILEQIIVENKLDKKVFMLGKIDRNDLPKYLSLLDVASLPQSVDKVGSFRYTTKISEYLEMKLPIVTGNLPFSYDVGDNFFIRVSGCDPWDIRYINALVEFLENLTSKDIMEMKSSIPNKVDIFNKNSQILRTTNFIKDLLRWKNENGLD
ncbi:glycosyltransferase [Metabacillus litoralis]|uniref:glycosyltransferase n=1 Tax=Metabacillus litoralis TaxID=152268 RepID=UPI0020422400|nr:glycosyltransferase [Metabacillus litoralis]MCM3409924.1 glycosyltransferase [Metabacillus litoralis]